MPATRLTPPVLESKHIEKFWSRVDCSATNGCWPWIGRGKRKHPNRYGKFTVGSRGRERCFRASRIAHFLATKQWPEQVIHSCDNPPCCNPAHLRSGTAKENTLDAVSKGRMARGSRNGSCLHPERRPRGERHGRAKLTKAAVHTIRRLLKQGISYAVIARRFDVTLQAVALIAHRRTWAWLS